MHVNARNPGPLPKSWRSPLPSSRAESSRFDTPMIRTQPPSPLMQDRATVGFDVRAVWKGAVYEDMYITTPPTGGSCGFTFSEGEEYLVYAHDSPYADDGYTVGICSRTALLQQAQVDIDALGGGYAPQAGTGGPEPEQPQDAIVSRAWAIILAAAVLVLLVGGVVAYAVLRRRSASPV